MNCWKSINISRDYGFLWLTMLSISAIILYFLFSYLVLSTLFPATHLVEYGFFPFLMGLLLVGPIHQLLHCLPLWLTGNRIHFKVRRQRRQVPIINRNVEKVISRKLFLVSLLAPAISVTIFCMFASYFMPQFVHYLSIFSALNIGLSVYDFIYAKQLLQAPKDCLIEDHEDGFHILIRKAA
ncbi:DUF3267 domain-containing protein [Desertibacillus haloalkaliphilus]|uniref:DUF3267 domain-containing protein n=1 Tax=Desertibacillus haloalkaliphilus TaxID=1328930 RepID=UPI001C27D765|nr:DUF3267 domain-containing protein [Desertibacillus haloalkaliphilus]MBU8905452.1 DUF3267 domain-containing protein [Desertibacillus haloalkaliphilus]